MGVRVGAELHRNGSVCRKFSSNSKGYKYIYIFKIKKKKKERDTANILKLKIETLGLQNQEPVFALVIYFQLEERSRKQVFYYKGS